MLDCLNDVFDELEYVHPAVKALAFIGFVVVLFAFGSAIGALLTCP